MTTAPVPEIAVPPQPETIPTVACQTTTTMTTSVHVPPTAINVSRDVQKQIADRAKRRIVRFFFTPHAMAAGDDEKRVIASHAITESIPLMPGVNGQFNCKLLCSNTNLVVYSYSAKACNG
jgi:hypothetical protein